MWKIKEIKKEARKIIKNNIWTLMFVGIVMSFVFGEYKISQDGFQNVKILNEFIQENKGLENKNGLFEKYSDRIISQILFGTSDGTIKDLNKEHNVTKGTFFVIFETITEGQKQLQHFVNSLTTDNNSKIKIAEILFIITSFLGIIIKVFVTNPIEIGENRIFLRNKDNLKVKFKHILFPYHKGIYINCVKTIFIRNLYKILWNLTLIGGIIKNYSYKMVPYILAENPTIDSQKVIKISRKMMNGNKLKTFWLDISFLGWDILQYITFGLVGIYVNPYKKATYTELYRKLREEYKNNKMEYYELLEDDIIYPFEEKSKIKIDYNKKYELTSIILFFFTFSFVGWLWEVLLYLFRDGILVNRGTFYGPWLPIYGTGCTIVILLTKFKYVRKMLKNPLLTFNVNMIICSIIEYTTSWYLEATKGIRYWDYTGAFMNINGRISLECSLFFGFGSCICVYFVAPFLEKQFQKITNKIKITICVILITLFSIDAAYSSKHIHKGEGITVEYNIIAN